MSEGTAGWSGAGHGGSGAEPGNGSSKPPPSDSERSRSAHRIMGLDVGQRTVGVAISDPLGLTAQGLEVVRIKPDPYGIRNAVERLRVLAEQWEIGLIVVGLPRRTNGTLGPEAQQVKEFVQDLQAEVDLPVELWDERFSTVSAERVLLEADVSRKRRKAVIDQVAASIILQSYLDGVRGGRKADRERND